MLSTSPTLTFIVSIPVFCLKKNIPENVYENISDNYKDINNVKINDNFYNEKVRIILLKIIY